VREKYGGAIDAVLNDKQAKEYFNNPIEKEIGIHQ
jgi:hypothetical protein